MPITPDEVKYVAHLSRLDLADEQKQRFAGQIGAILAYMEKLNELDTSEVEPMVHGIEAGQRMRTDEVAQSLPREEALENAPESTDGYFRVPRIIE